MKILITDSDEFIINEFKNVSIGDKRLNKRLEKIVPIINSSPTKSLPQMYKANKSELKALYRLFQNEKINYNNILQTHYLNTLERMTQYNGKILIIFDTTFVTPSRHVDGLMDRGKGKDNCIRCHYGLAVSEDGKTIFGILNFTIMDKFDKEGSEYRNESDIWLKSLESCVDLFYSSPAFVKLIPRSIVVADREADEFEFLDYIVSRGLGFIIRSQYNRNANLKDFDHSMDEAELYARKHGVPYKIKVCVGSKTRPVKVQREIIKDIEVLPPQNLKKNFKSLKLNVVIVKSVPGEENLIKWRILTSEQIDEANCSEKIISQYSKRWTIEEVNKAAKSGVWVEKRQFTDLNHFKPFLAIAFVVAWRMVALRSIAIHQPDTLVKHSFTPEEVKYFEAESKKSNIKILTVTDAVYFIAQLGGYIKTKSNPRPGWITLWKGFMTFNERVEGFSLALSYG
jgi:hypothetical protein